MVDLIDGKLIESSLVRSSCDSSGSAHSILEKWKECVIKCIGNHIVDGIGFAMPGPFMYDKGISLMNGLGKFDSLFGVNIRQYFSSAFNIPGENIKFLNDAACFALGEYYFGSAKSYKKGIYLTIGTGFGSTFLDDGSVMSTGENVPEHGWLYHVPFQNSIAEEFFSEKWILKRYFELSGVRCEGVKDISEKKQLENLFQEFTSNLANFLEHWIRVFEAKCLVIGGNILKYKADLILPVLQDLLAKMNLNVDVVSAELFEDGAILGASAAFKEKVDSTSNNTFRVTNQNLLPLRKNIEKNIDCKYDMYPVFDCGNNKILFGYDSLVDMICDKREIVIDGYSGVIFEHIREEIDRRLKIKNKTVLWLEAVAALKSEEEIELMLEPFLGGNDPLFGKKCTLDFAKFFVNNALIRFKNDDKFDINIYIGIGSSLIRSNAPVVYFDVCKNEIQYRSRAKSIYNFGLKKSILSSKEAYKRFYFIDWPILNSYKKLIKDRIEIYVDDQRYKTPVWMKGEELCHALLNLSQSVIRVRPWFESGVWGGTWMKENIPKIAQNVINYAWSFELIAPENGIILASDNYMLEVSFDLFMYHMQTAILGKRAAEIYGYEFTIRFDFLDTFDGDNLSIQCHPGKRYMHENFNETLPQDETYYILDTKENAKVFLGFHEAINEEEFQRDVTNSFQNSARLDIEKYVKSHESKKHDFFLIPNGTIHGSGRNNLVLEISSTPYIFTFKIYDWLRADLDGKPRTLNIKRAFENLDFNQKGNVIEKELISFANLIESTNEFSIYHLQTHKTHFYDVHRIELINEIKLETNDQFHILMVVEGDYVQVLIDNNKYTQKFHFAETFIIPAASKSYRIKNETNKICKIVKAFLK